MTALALERLTPSAGSYPSRGTYPIRANVLIYKGSQVGLDSSGRAMPANTIANSCVRIVGKASATYDNRTGSALGGAAGAVDVEVEFGIFQWANSDSIAAADVGKACYAVDDQTVALSDSGETRPFAGIILEVVDSKPYVFQGPSVLAPASSASLDSPTKGLHMVRGASTANIADLSAASTTIDGITYVNGERMLAKDQSTGSQNGIYVWSGIGGGTGVLTRADDANGSDEVVAGMLVHVSEGTVAANRFYFLSTNDPITVGSTSLSFTQLPAAADLASTSATFGLNMIGYEDAGGFTAAATGDAALDEIYQHLRSTQAFVSIPLTAWREVDSAGAVANAAGNGGVLASDTTPVLGAAATSEAMQIVWAAGNTDIIQASVPLPPDLDDTADAILDLFVLTDNSGGGGIDAASFTVNTSWGNGAQVVDTATDGTPATTVHKIQATIAAADIPADPFFVNIQLVGAAHAADPTHLLGARLLYKRKLLTS